MDSSSVAVWEVQNEFFEDWQMYTAEFCETLEKAYSKYCKNPTAENRIAKLAQNRAFDFKQREEVDRSNGSKTYPIHRLEVPRDSALAKGIVWNWNNNGRHRSPDWKPYRAEVVNYLEEEYQNKKDSINLNHKFKTFDYTIDFNYMVQVNNSTGTKRDIERGKLRHLYPKAEKNITSKIGVSNLQNGSKSTKSSTNKPTPTYNYSKSILVPPDVQAFARAVTDIPNEDCSICMTSLLDESGFDNAGGKNFCHVVELKQCQHRFHALCIKAAFDNSSDKSLMCPYCKKIYGTKKGTQPRGHMTHGIVHQRLPGFTCQTISINYDIQSGIQGNEHPNPGQRYHAAGFPRQAYLPDNKEGRKILKLLKVAWDRRLIFTIGRSVTSGSDNCVTWNEIHHKTSMHRGGSHGYPDPGYFTNVIEELKAQGVTEADI